MRRKGHLPVATETLADRLRRRRLELGFEHAADAARQYGWNVRTYQAHENGSKEPGKNYLKRYMNAYRMKYDELVTGKKQIVPKGDNMTQPLLAFRPINLLDIEALSSVSSIGDMINMQPKRVIYGNKIKDLGPEARAVEAPDDSMLDPSVHDRKNISLGEEVIFDPGKKPKEGDLVIAKLSKPDRIVIRQYALYAQADGRRGIRLIPRNKHFEDSFIMTADDGFILGCVRRVQSGRDL